MPDSEIVGGISVSLFNEGDGNVVEYANSPYSFFSITLQDGAAFRHSDIASYTLFCLFSEPGGGVKLENAGDLLNMGDSAIIEGGFEITAISGTATMLVAAVHRGVRRENHTAITQSGNQYKVPKPWGHELWINGEDPDYCFKEVFIRAGNRTSLQYHNYKHETNVLVRGHGELVYKSREESDPDHVGPNDLSSLPLHPISCADVPPRTLHRIEATTDILLYEVSTPYLDDVIRIQDDFSRRNGRIVLEHGGKDFE